MITNKENSTVHCFWCNKWYDLYTEVFLNLEYEGSISCPCNHIIGSEWNCEWKDFIGQYKTKFVLLML